MKFDIVICNYVLNVVDGKEATEIMEHINDLLEDDGIAYISVRRDVKKDGFTSKGTFQRNVILDLPSIFETKSCCIYMLIK